MAAPRLPFMGIDPYMSQKLKYKKLKAALGNPPDQALCGSLYLFWSAVFSNKPDGFVSEWSDEDIDTLASWNENGSEKSLAREMRRLGWIDPSGHIHDWHEWGGFLYVERARSAERTAAYRSRRAKPQDDDLPIEPESADGDVTEPEGDATSRDGNRENGVVTGRNVTVTHEPVTSRLTNKPTNETNETEPNVNGSAAQDADGPKTTRTTKTTKTRKAFTPPTEAEWIAYSYEHHPEWPKRDVLRAYTYYDTRGWSDIKNWKGCVRTCYLNWQEKMGVVPEQSTDQRKSTREKEESDAAELMRLNELEFQQILEERRKAGVNASAGGA